MIAGIVVSGFGLASVYTAPLSNWLIRTYGLNQAVMILGLLFLVVVVGLSQLLRVPEQPLQFGASPAAGAATVPVRPRVDILPGDMLRTPVFYMLWFMFACGSGAGLMVIAKLASIAQQQAGLHLGFLLVAALAIGNGGGRILTGTLSDKWGRKPTLFFCFVFQAVLVLVLSLVKQGSPLAAVPVMVALSALIGANYGANLAIFPSITKDYYGLKHFGVNYGLVFTSWGVGGFMLALLAGKMYDKYHSFNVAYYGAAVLLALAALVTLMVKPPVAKED